MSSAATYPRAKKTDDPGMFLNEPKNGIEQGQINWIGNKTSGTDTSNERHEAFASQGERANTATSFHLCNAIYAATGKRIRVLADKEPPKRKRLANK